MFIPIDCWLFVPSLSGLPLVPVPPPGIVERGAFVRAWPFGGAGAASAPRWPVIFVRFSLVWGWLRFRASVGPFASLVCLRGLLLLLPLRLPWLSTCAMGTSFLSRIRAPSRFFLPGGGFGAVLGPVVLSVVG